MSWDACLAHKPGARAPALPLCLLYACEVRARSWWHISDEFSMCDCVFLTFFVQGTPVMQHQQDLQDATPLLSGPQSEQQWPQQQQLQPPYQDPHQKQQLHPTDNSRSRAPSGAVAPADALPQHQAAHVSTCAVPDVAGCAISTPPSLGSCEVLYYGTVRGYEQVQHSCITPPSLAPGKQQARLQSRKACSAS